MQPLNIIQSRTNIDLLVTPETLLTDCNLSANIQATNIIPSIVIAQDTIIKPILGETLYNELFAEFLLVLKNPNNLPDGTLTPFVDYKTLYNKMKPALVWWSYVMFIPVNAVRVEEKGVMLNDSDFGVNAGTEGMKLIETRARKIAEQYTEILHSYLADKFKNDTEFKQETKNEGRLFSGIYFSRGKRCK